MATEPGTTSPNYDPSQTYTPPVGRLPVLGKIRAEIDRIRAAAANDRNLIVNRNLAQIDSNAKITSEIANDATRTADNTTKITAEVSMLTAEETALGTRVLNETAKNDAEVTALTARTTNETNKTNAEVTALDARTTNETDKTAAEIVAMQARTVNENTQTVNDTTRTTNDTNRAINEITNNTNKTTAEISLLEQKRESELAQVSDSVSTGTVAGVLGIQKELFAKQRDGFDRDAEQKLAKIVLDTWSMRQTTDGNQVTDTAGIDNPEIKKVVDKAKRGINDGVAL